MKPVQKLEEMVSHLQAIASKLEEQLNLSKDRRKGEMQETMTEQLQKHDYALATKRLIQEIEILKFENEYMNYLSCSMRNLRPPLNLYSVFLKENLISLRLSTVTMRYHDHIETEDQFSVAFSRSNDEEQDFLCELYMHNLIMVDYEDWDPSPRVGELQLRAFMSFMRNKLKWNNDATFVDNIKWEDAL